MTSSIRSFLAFAAISALCVLPIAAVAQLPTSISEQINLYNSLSPAQQQAVLQQLPASQREALIRMLGGQSGVQAGEEVLLDTDLEELSGSLAVGLEPEEMEETEVFGPRDTLVIEFRERGPDEIFLTEDALTADEQAAQREFVRRLIDGNPYRLDNAGRLYLPGVPPIELAGLDVDQATVRLGAQRDLRPFGLLVTKLTLAPVGAEALELYGYDLFKRGSSLFTSTGDIPVPVDYVIGPGDTINLQLLGNDEVSGTYELRVSREGTINLPEIGPLNVSGQSFDAARALINDVADRQLLASATVTLGELRSISVRVLGEVVRPGTYTLNPLVSMTDAIIRSGGVNEIGSLRRIELKRDGQTESILDVYDLALSGDTSGDQRLQQGDSVFVPTIGDTVTVEGEVLRPAIYELNGEQTVAEIVQLAGGLRPTASPSSAKLERIVPGRGVAVTELDLAAGGGITQLRSGDVVRVEPSLDLLEGAVRLMGNVQRAGLHPWYPGMTISRLLPSPEFVKPLSDLGYVMIRREPRPNVEVQILSVDLGAVWAGRTGAVDLELQPRDTVYVFHAETGRRQYVAPILEELSVQTGSAVPLPMVRIDGEVRATGEYPLEPGMRVSDLLRAGGGLSDAAYATHAELTRYRVIDGEQRDTELINVDLASVLAGDLSADILLSPYDFLSISKISGWSAQTVTLRGEFKRPGTYPIRRGETLLSVVERAGGLTEFAFVEGSVFTRVELKEREEEERGRLAARIEADLAALDLSEQGASDSLETGQTILRQLRDTAATGRQVIRLNEMLAGTTADIALSDGDELFVPELRQEVTVIGEVQYPTSHTYEPGLSRDNYVDKSGGLTRRADKGRVYVVRANGEVVIESGGRWFRRGQGGGVRPGDTVVAPIDVDRTRPLQLWAEVSQIVYSMAIAAAAVNSF